MKTDIRGFVIMCYINLRLTMTLTRASLL